MNIKIINNPEDALNICNNINSETGSNELMLGVLKGYIDHPDQCNEYFIYNISDSLIGLWEPPHPLLLYTNLKGKNLKQAIGLMSDSLKSENKKIPGVNAHKDIAEYFSARWTDKNKVQYKAVMNLRSFVLKKVRQININSNGKLGKAKHEDHQLLLDWMNQFDKELGGVFPEGYIQKHLKNTIELKRAYIWYVENKVQGTHPVSMVFCDRPTPEGISINYVYTLPDYRNQGYASTAVSHLCERLLSGGYKYCTLFTDLHNATSNSIYQKIGFLPVADFKHLEFIYPED